MPQLTAIHTTDVTASHRLQQPRALRPAPRAEPDAERAGLPAKAERGTVSPATSRGALRVPLVCGKHHFDKTKSVSMCVGGAVPTSSSRSHRLTPFRSHHQLRIRKEVGGGLPFLVPSGFPVPNLFRTPPVGVGRRAYEGEARLGGVAHLCGGRRTWGGAPVGGREAGLWEGGSMRGACAALPARSLLRWALERRLLCRAGCNRSCRSRRRWRCERKWTGQRQRAVINHRPPEPVKALSGLMPLSVAASPTPSVIV